MHMLGTTKTKQLGSFGLWLWARVVQLLVFAFFADTTVLLVRFRGPDLSDVLLFLLLASVALSLHPVAYGFANNSGVSFRRYFKRRFVSWENIAAVEWGALRGIRVVLRESNGGRTLLFSDNPSLSEFAAQLRGRSVPEIVTWVRSRISRADAAGQSPG